MVSALDFQRDFPFPNNELKARWRVTPDGADDVDGAAVTLGPCDGCPVMVGLAVCVGATVVVGDPVMVGTPVTGGPVGARDCDGAGVPPPVGCRVVVGGTGMACDGAAVPGESPVGRKDVVGSAVPPGLGAGVFPDPVGCSDDVGSAVDGAGVFPVPVGCCVVVGAGVPPGVGAVKVGGIVVVGCSVIVGSAVPAGVGTDGEGAGVLSDPVGCSEAVGSAVPAGLGAGVEPPPSVGCKEALGGGVPPPVGSSDAVGSAVPAGERVGSKGIASDGRGVAKPVGLGDTVGAMMLLDGTLVGENDSVGSRVIRLVGPSEAGARVGLLLFLGGRGQGKTGGLLQVRVE